MAGVLQQGPPAKRCSHSREKFVDIERLDDIVVCSKVESLDPVLAGSTRRQHQNEDLEAGLPYFAADGPTVFSSQSNVQNNEIVRIRKALFNPDSPSLATSTACNSWRTPLAIIRAASSSSSIKSSCMPPVL